MSHRLSVRWHIDYLLDHMKTTVPKFFQRLQYQQLFITVFLQLCEIFYLFCFKNSNIWNILQKENSIKPPTRLECSCHSCCYMAITIPQSPFSVMKTEVHCRLYHYDWCCFLRVWCWFDTGPQSWQIILSTRMGFTASADDFDFEIYPIT